jgi:replicative DNA helicase
MNIAEHVAVELKLPVGVFSLEMTVLQLLLRMTCSRARVSLRNVAHGALDERDFPKLTLATGVLNKVPLYICDAGGLSVAKLRGLGRRMRDQFKIALLIIDYIQLLHGHRAENRQQEMTEISQGIKALAKELGIPIIALSQLNRDMERDKGKSGKGRKPRLSDLRESGAIEQDADVVGLLYRPDGEAEGDDKSDAIAVNLLIAKQRNGPLADIPLVFMKSYTRFESAAKVESDSEMPNYDKD